MNLSKDGSVNLFAIHEILNKGERFKRVGLTYNMAFPKRLFSQILTTCKAAKSEEILSITKSQFGVRIMRLSDLEVQALLNWRKVLN